MDDTRRRRVLQLGGAALVSAIAGCNSVVDDNEDDVQDTDGDAVGGSLWCSDSVSFQFQTA